MPGRRTYTPRINAGGNFCGHDPHEPVLMPVLPLVEGAPSVLYELRRRLLAYYDAPRDKLPTLEACNNSTRLQRSERREALVRLLWCLICHLELSSLRVGKPTEGGFQCHTLKVLAKRADLSMTRAARAMHDLIRAGIVVSSQLRELDDDGCYQCHPASRRIAPELFALFGLEAQLEKHRTRAANRLKQLARSVQSTVRQLLSLKLVTNAMRSQRREGKRQGVARTNMSAQGPPEARIAKVLQQVLQEHPEWDYQSVRTEMKRRIA